MAKNADGTDTIASTPATGTFGTTNVSPTGTPVVIPDAAVWEAHPIYVVRQSGVGSLVKGSVLLAGDLGSETDIRRLEELGAIAAWHTDEAHAALADAAATPAPKEVPVTPLEATPAVQQGIPYVDEKSGK